MGAPVDPNAMNKSFTSPETHYKQIPPVSRVTHNFREQIRLSGENLW